jgi:hypothetical protein
MLYLTTSVKVSTVVLSSSLFTTFTGFGTLHCNMMAVTCGAGTAYPPGAPELTPSF